MLIITYTYYYNYYSLYLCLFISDMNVQDIYVYKLKLLYHTISLSTLMKIISETMFSYCPSNSKISLKSLLCLKEKQQTLAFLFLYCPWFSYFSKCSQSCQQNQAKCNPKMPKIQLWMWSGGFFSLENIYQLL